MLAQNKKKLTFILTIAVVMTTSVALFGQQLPSQRYQPAPPSVHVPPANINRIQSPTTQARLPESPDLNTRPASYRFSDEAAPAPQFEAGTIQQTSYTSDGDEIQVPNILVASNEPLRTPSGQPSADAQTASQGYLPNRQFDPANVNHEPISASHQEMVQQIQRATPLVDPEVLRNQQDQVKNQLMQIRDRTQAAANQFKQASHESAGLDAEVIEDDASRMHEGMTEVSTLATQQPDQFSASPQTPKRETPMLTAKPIHVASSNIEIDDPVNHIRKVSGETTEPIALPNETHSSPEISLTAPGIEVQTYGPRTIGINKNSTFRIVVTNRGSIDARQILIGINLPQWVDIANTNLTSGQKEITDGVNQSRMVWTIDSIPANSYQTITIDTVPRKAEMFDLGVEWTFAPQIGSTSIDVTEPRLEMTIAGPRDVLYGEKAIYHVTVRNPGTGTAENVSVMLPEALGGERATLGEIAAGNEKNFQVELLARTAGQLDLAATAKADGDLNTQAVRQISVRRANLGVIIDGPPMKYAGGIGTYTITINNTGDATAQDVVAAIALPTGVKYLGGVDSAKEIEGGLRWQVGTIDSGDERTFSINCELNAAGDLQVEAGARGQGDLAASSACVTTVETVADLVLTVRDPKGPLPTGEDVTYEIQIKNRGTRAARDVQLVMQFSEGIEPNDAQGLKHRVVPGQILFSPIAQVDAGEELKFQVSAKAHMPGTHVFRAQLTCADSDSREIAEGTTRFFGEMLDAPASAKKTSTADASNDFAPSKEVNDLDR